MAVNHSFRLKLALTILFAFVSVLAAPAQSSDEPSLGDVARTKRQKKPAASVIDNEEMVRRDLAHPSADAFECNAECKAKAKALAYWDFSNGTEKWQEAFAAAVADLSQGDWGHRLSEIREKVCSDPGNADSKPLKALEEELFSKLRLEGREKHIDDTAAAHANNAAAGAEALRQLRVQDLKTGILEAKVELMRSSCASAAKVPGK